MAMLKGVYLKIKYISRDSLELLALEDSHFQKVYIVVDAGKSLIEYIFRK